MARGRYRRILFWGVLPLFLSGVVAGAYVVWKVARHASYAPEESSPFPAHAEPAKGIVGNGGDFAGESSDTVSIPLRVPARTDAATDERAPRVAATPAALPKAFDHASNSGAATQGSIRIEERRTSRAPGSLSIRGTSPKDVSRRKDMDPEPQLDRIRITRARAPNSLHAMLVAGFDAFERGDDASASAAYRKVLRKRPDDRDALLGLAAVAMRERQWESAANHYLRILRRNPKDSVAQAALIGIRDNLDPALGEGRIKQLLEKEPDAPHLHFSLGNLYSRQSRWIDAERAYFNAYRMDDANADYCHNLAVSLDHLARRSAALTYYRRSLELAGERSLPPRFDPKVVLRRIDVIESALDVRK